MLSDTADLPEDVVIVEVGGVALHVKVGGGDRPGPVFEVVALLVNFTAVRFGV